MKLFKNKYVNILIEENLLNFIMSNLLRCETEIEYLNKNKIYKDIILVDTYVESLNLSLKIQKKNKKIVLKLGRQFSFILSLQQLRVINKQIYAHYTKKFKFDFKTLDPVYFSIFLWRLLPKIVKIKKDKIFLDDLRVPRDNDKKIRLEETACFQTLNDRKKANLIYTPFKSNHVCQTDLKRLDEVFKSVKKNGYPYKNQLIVLYNNENIIRDGQHRACSLKKLYGNIEVDVLRIYFKK